MRVLVCGGRNYSDRETMDLVLRRYIRPMDSGSLVITGSAPGADTLAESWCLANGVHVILVPALWSVHGRGAGPIRNSVMLTLSPELVLAFPGGRGTEDMVRQANAADVSVLRVTGPKEK